MAIKVIEHGKKNFTKVCPECGCKFEYESEDLEIDRSICLTSYPVRYNRVVTCPECGRKIYHDTFLEIPKSVTVALTPHSRTLDCETCPNKPDPDHPTVGDTVCTFCPKMQPLVISGDSSKDLSIK